MTARAGAACCIGVCDKWPHSLNLCNSFFPMFSSELDGELMKGEVEGWESVGTSKTERLRDKRSQSEAIGQMEGNDPFSDEL